MKPTLKASSLVCLGLLGMGCGQQEADTQALVADALYMARLHADWERQLESQGLGRGSHMKLDLSDDIQYRFVRRRLQAAGSTPRSSPRLYRELQALREDRHTSTTAGQGEGNTWCGHLLSLTDVVRSEASVAKFQASGLVTCLDGSDYAFANVTAFATNRERTRFRVLGSESLEEYAGVVLETPPLDIRLEVDPDEELFVDSLAMAFDEQTGETHLSYAVAESSLPAAELPNVNVIHYQHPKELIGRHLVDNPIRTCLERGSVSGFLDCDYTSGNKDPVTGLFKPFVAPFTGVAAVDAESSRTLWIQARDAYWEPANGGYDITHLYLPLRGTYQVRLPSDCTLSTLTSDANLILLERGGRCTAGAAPGTPVLKGSIPFKAPFLDEHDRTLLYVPFDGLVDFGKDCLAVYQNVRLLTRSTLRATCVDYRTGATRTHLRSHFQSIENLDWRNACLAEGTRVTKADGSQVPVEQVKVGDQLLANGQGLVLTVTTVSRGAESKPLVELRDALGGEVRVTQTHPMVTATRGVVQAGELKVGEALLTRTGPVKLVGVERVPSSGQVFNFALGTREELAHVPAEARTLYANGYLVGDSQMQSALEKQRSRDVREVLSRLDGAWHEDFRRHQARNSRARR